MFFLFNNLHFAAEILGALAFLVVAWLAWDAFMVRRDFLTASRGIGFLLLAFWQVLHAFQFASDLWGYVAYAFYVLGLLMVFLNLIMERPVQRPEFKAILFLPSLTFISPYVHGLALALYVVITYLAWRQYKYELKKNLKPFWMGFLFLSLGALTSLFYAPDSLGALWALGHLLELIGFGGLLVWVWQYLQLRIREELILIFTSLALLIAIVVTMVFSTILVRQIERDTQQHLLTNARVLDFSIARLKEEALAKAQWVASQPEIQSAMAKNDFDQLERLAKSYLNDQRLGFLLFVNPQGEVLLRAHALTQREDNVSSEQAVRGGLAGKSIVTIESSPSEKFSIRAASPIGTDKRLGVVVAGFPLDNALVDNIKRITGLDMSIYEVDTVAATTLFQRDGTTRGIATKHTDENVRAAVLQRGEAITVRTEILSRPYLSGYLPLYDADGRVVGMLASARAQSDLVELSTRTNRLTLITVAIIMLILIIPLYVITQRLAGEVR